MFDTVFPTCTHYPYLSDAYLACVARTFTLTIYHPVSRLLFVSIHFQLTELNADSKYWTHFY